MSNSKLEFSNIQWLSGTPSGVMGGGTPEQRQRLVSADVECMNCGNTWRMSRGNKKGQFIAAIGEKITCPECDETALIPTVSD